jgi:hypothetical protein
MECTTADRCFFRMLSLSCPSTGSTHRQLEQHRHVGAEGRLEGELSAPLVAAAGLVPGSPLGPGPPKPGPGTHSVGAGARETPPQGGEWTMHSKSNHKD